MPNISNGNGKDSTSSGHGALGMGGQPSDDPRDLKRGGEGRSNSDLGGGTGPVSGADGVVDEDLTGGGTSNETLGVEGDKALDTLPNGRTGSRP